MKNFSISASFLLGLVTVSLQAGEPVAYKQVAPPPPPLYGTGFYGAIDAGANVFQNFGDTRTFDDSFTAFGTRLDLDLKIEPQHEVGFFGGIKLGYVFGTGVVRPTIEGDFFYNGFRTGWDGTLNTAFTACRGCQPVNLGSVNGNVNTWVNSGAFLVNFILRFAPGNQKFQPYAGAGVGVYYEESAGTQLTNPNTGTVTVNTGGGRNHADLAWQIIAGTDYYWTPKFSTFIEYKFLEYESTQIDTRQSRVLGQQLIGAGVRFHF